MSKKGIIILLFILVLVTSGTTLMVRFYPQDSLKYSTVKVNGLDREFYYYVPANVSKHPKLLFALHSSNNVARDMQLMTGNQFNNLADKYKDMIIVYPQGYDRRWNDCRASNDNYSRYHNIDDVAFIEKTINYFSTNCDIDKSNVYAMGYATGSLMCYKLAKERPDLFKGVAVVCATLPTKTNDDCHESSKPVSMLIINGTADPIFKYDGGDVISPKGKNAGPFLSTMETISYWLSLDKGDTDVVATYKYPEIAGNDNTSVYQYYYPCPKTNKKVMLVKVVNGGHVFPNPVYQVWPSSVGNVTNDINAAEVIVDFFRGL